MRLLAILGGQIGQRPQRLRGSSWMRQSFRHYINGTDCLSALSRLFPFFVTKRDEASIAIEYCEWVSKRANKRWTDSDLATAKTYSDRLKAARSCHTAPFFKSDLTPTVAKRQG